MELLVKKGAVYLMKGDEIVYVWQTVEEAIEELGKELLKVKCIQDHLKRECVYTQTLFDSL